VSLTIGSQVNLLAQSLVICFSWPNAASITSCPPPKMLSHAKSGQAPGRTLARVEAGAWQLSPEPRPGEVTGRDARLTRRRDACATMGVD
jgi:hypothetical protein